MDKVAYLVRTLSRTRRKDYENYVVNAVWQRLGDASLKPVTQQLVRKPDGSCYFIDFFFPQLGIGIECDEEYHDSREQSRRDRCREIELIDIIRQVSDEEYTPLHVSMGGRTLEEIDAAIDECVERIRLEAARRRAEGTFAEWTFGQTPQETLAGKSVLKVSDDIGFSRIAETCNAVMGCSYGGMQRSFFPPEGLRKRGDDTYAWFPKLSVDGTTPASASGWVNTISPDGMRIFEHNTWKEGWRNAAFPEVNRVVFAQMRDSVTGERLYRFVGVFAFAELGRNAAGLECNVYRRVSDTWDIVRPYGFATGDGRQVAFLEFAVSLLEEVAGDPQKARWCEESGAAEEDRWNLGERIGALMRDAYECGFVPSDYGAVYDSIGDDALYLRAAGESEFAALSDRQVIAVVAKQFRSDHFVNGSLVETYIAKDLMRPYLAELLRRWSEPGT